MVECGSESSQFILIVEGRNRGEDEESLSYTTSIALKTIFTNTQRLGRPFRSGRVQGVHWIEQHVYEHGL